jgi:glycosyltransferase involved in cell wall biosynthesis
MEVQTLREQLAAAGYERARRFSWESAVEQTWKVYQELLN